MLGFNNHAEIANENRLGQLPTEIGPSELISTENTRSGIDQKRED